ncbi:MAG: hypothetical protein JW927_15880 [Deltaproteobacteria bacterium]|nr:hypothetical protein [Deltaproteobacteria bacterium]
MIIWIILISFLLLFLLPFIPGLIEIIKKEDAEPLPIEMDYIRHPRYFAKSFRKILEKATSGFNLGHGIHNVKLSKDEPLAIHPSLNIGDGEIINHLLLIKGNFVSGSDVQLNKEVHVTGDVIIGPNNVLQALSIEGNAQISDGVRFRRWLDAEGDIIIKEDCNLGISVSSAKKLLLSENCIFHRLFGRPVISSNPLSTTINPFETFKSQEITTQQNSFIRKRDKVLPPGTIEINNVVFMRDIRIGYGSIFEGDIKSYGRIILEEGVKVYGNIFSEGDIIIGRNARIGGHIFSQTSIHISEGSCISLPEEIKSVIAKKAIHIENNVTIYGYISTEGVGSTQKK